MRDYEGNEIIASNAANAKGLRKFEDLANKSVALQTLGSPFHYQLGQIANREGIRLCRRNAEDILLASMPWRVRWPMAKSTPRSCRRCMRANC